jgi:UDP-N-acetylglucosamine 2-epimerase (non-hydrolysing)
VRDNTERPITITDGTNTLTGPDPAKIWPVFEEVLATGGKRGRIPEYWDGQAAVRIAAFLRGWLDTLG